MRGSTKGRVYIYRVCVSFDWPTITGVVVTNQKVSEKIHLVKFTKL